LVGLLVSGQGCQIYFSWHRAIQ